MQSPYKVSLSLFRGAALVPYTCLVMTVLATSQLDALSNAESEMNVVVGDDVYAVATDARPVWQSGPRPPVSGQALALVA